MKITRREFLKLTSILPAAYYLPRILLTPPRTQPDANMPNILIILFDALTALNISFLGYGRETMPYLTQLADKATVYHNHYASGNFTTPGTASLLTGTYPWTNRGIFPGKPMAKEFLTKNIFHLLDQYYRLTYSHNPYVNSFQIQFEEDIDFYKPRHDLLTYSDRFINDVFKNDEDVANLGWSQGIKLKTGYAYSLFLSHIYQQFKPGTFGDLSQTFPRGLPFLNKNNYYRLEDAINWTHSELTITPQPFLGYFHYLPPHYPYLTRKEFIDVFKGDQFAPTKKIHPITNNDKLYRGDRRWYDEFILYADAEFKRFYDLMEESGLLENTWIILTSDHGEIFERGAHGHGTEMLYEPLVRIPLLIFEAGQQTRRDIHTATSAVDILPTLLHITGKEIPEWCEGEVLPPYRPANQNRSIFAQDAVETGEFDPITEGTTMIVKNQYKLIWYFGYEILEGKPLYELFDLENDPEEMNNIYFQESTIARELLEELETKTQEANQPYQK